MQALFPKQGLLYTKQIKLIDSFSDACQFKRPLCASKGTDKTSTPFSTQDTQHYSEFSAHILL